MNSFELCPLSAQGQKSFYGKARVEEDDKKATLYSYGTKVAEYDKIKKEFNVLLYYSNTTGRHLNAFLVHYGHKKLTKKEMFKEFSLTK